MDDHPKSNWFQRAQEFLLHRLFLLDHQRVRNTYLLLLGDLLELAALMFYLLGPTLQLPGPLLQLFSHVLPWDMQIGEFMMVSNWSAADSISYIPAGVIALNLVIIVLTAMVVNRLDSIMLLLI
jgi:hypothetical protein